MITSIVTGSNRAMSIKSLEGCRYIQDDANDKKDFIIPFFEDIKIPEVPKLKFLPKVPQHPPGLRPPKMRKGLEYMRGEEEVHNNFIHNQYGIVATHGGQMHFVHFEMVRNKIYRNIDVKRMFAEWRVEAPWKACTKKGIGKRMGGGKGSIHHYVTPVKSGRVIIELGGKITFEEVEPLLKKIANSLPFGAIVTTQKRIEAKRAHQKKMEDLNINPYTFKYCVQNNMAGCSIWIKPDIDWRYFGKHT